MRIFARRLLAIALGGLIGAVAIGLLAPTATILAIGILALGLAMIVAILFYLLRPVPSELIGDVLTFPPASTITTGRTPAKRTRREREPSADIIVFPRAPD